MNEKLKANAGWIAVAVALAAAVVVVLVVSRREPGARLRPPPAIGTDTDTGDALPSVSLVQERMADPVYVAALHEIVEERRAVIVEAAGVRERMATVVTAAQSELEAEAEASARARGESLDELPPVTEEALKERAMQHPDWPALEAELLTVQRELNVIQQRAETTIRERMTRQYATRRAARDTAGSEVAPMMAVPEVKLLEHPQPEVERIVITNVPPAILDSMPARPDRRPVAWPEAAE